MFHEVSLDPAEQWRAATDDDGKLRAMAELLVAMSLRHQARSLEFRTIDGEFRIAMLDDDGAHEFPQPPEEAKASLLQHCRRLSAIDRSGGTGTVTIRLGTGTASAFVQADADDAIWTITSNTTSADEWDELLGEFWAFRDAELPWRRRAMRHLRSLCVRSAVE